MRFKIIMPLIAVSLLLSAYIAYSNGEDGGNSPAVVDTELNEPEQRSLGIPIVRTTPSLGLWLHRDPCEYFSDLQGQPEPLQVVSLTSYPTRLDRRITVFTVAETRDEAGDLVRLAFNGGRISEDRERSAELDVEVGETLHVFLESARWDEELSSYWVTEEKVIHEEPRVGPQTIYGTLQRDGRDIGPRALSGPLSWMRASRDEDCYYDWRRDEVETEVDDSAGGEHVIVLTPGDGADDDAGIHFPAENPLSTEQPNR